MKTGNTATGIAEGVKVKDQATVKNRANGCRQGQWESQAQQPQCYSSATKLQCQENSHVLRQLVSIELTSADTYSTGVVLTHHPPPSPPHRELQATECCSVTLQTIHIKAVTLKFWGAQTSGYMLASEQCFN